MPCSVGQGLFSSPLWGRTLSLCLVLWDRAPHPSPLWGRGTPSSAAPMGNRVHPSLLHSPLWGRNLHGAMEQPPCPCIPLRGDSQGVWAVLLGCLAALQWCHKVPVVGQRGQPWGTAPDSGLGLHHPGAMEEGAGEAQRDRGHVLTQRPSCLDPLDERELLGVPPHAQLRVPRSPLFPVAAGLESDTSPCFPGAKTGCCGFLLL